MSLQSETLEGKAIELSNTKLTSREFKQACLELLLENGLSRYRVSELLGFSYGMWSYWINSDTWFREELEKVKEKYGDNVRLRLAKFAQRDDKIGMVTNFFIGKAYCDEFADKRVKIDKNVNHSITFKGISSEPEPVSIDKSKVIDIPSSDVTELEFKSYKTSKLTLD